MNPWPLTRHEQAMNTNLHYRPNMLILLSHVARHVADLNFIQTIQTSKNLMLQIQTVIKMP